MSDSWTLRVGHYTTPPLSLNDRLHWRVKAKITAEVREYVKQSAWYNVPACERILVELHYVPRDRRRRDRDNLVATLKPCLDGLVSAGVVADDAPEYVDWGVFLDDPDPKDPHLYLRIERT